MRWRRSKAGLPELGPVRQHARSLGIPPVKHVAKNGRRLWVPASMNRHVWKTWGHEGPCALPSFAIERDLSANKCARGACPSPQPSHPINILEDESVEISALL